MAKVGLSWAFVWYIMVISFTPSASWVEIPRESSLSLESFFELYEKTHTPVIIEDYGYCFGSMTVENIDRICGRKTVPIKRRTDEPGAWGGLEVGEFRTETLREALGTILNPAAQDSTNFSDVHNVIGVFDWSLVTYCPELLSTSFVVPKYFAQDFLQRVPPDQKLKYRDAWPSLFVGLDGSASAPHEDSFGSAFWQYVVRGAKEWRVVENLRRADLFQGIAHYRGTVREGELIYLPGGVTHQVKNLGNTVSLAGNFLGPGEMELGGSCAAEIAMAPEYPEYQEVTKAVLRPGFDFNVDLGLGDMAWRDFKTQDQWLRAEGHAPSP